jgi:3-oxoacyl-[acyl-carrier-protein] synthase-3
MTTQRFSRIIGTGSALPERCVKNEELVRELAQRGLETSDDWIVERTGIRQRFLGLKQPARRCRQPGSHLNRST